MSEKSFSDRQGQYLAFINAYTRVHGRPPAETDMQRHFQVTPPSVHQMILTLERAGLIRRQPGVARSIEVLVAPEGLPLLRHPPTGQILCAEDLVSYSGIKGLGRFGGEGVRHTAIRPRPLVK
jgi:DNA-binding MarR family transcriptional regulator